MKDEIKDIKGMIQSKKYNDAIKKVNKLIKKDEKAEYYNLRANINMRRNETKEAIKDFDKAINIDKKSHLLKLNKAFALFKLGKNKEAEGILTKAIKQKKAPEIYEFRSRVNISLGNYEQAVQDIDEGVQLNPLSEQLIKKQKSISEIINAQMISKNRDNLFYDKAQQYFKDKEFSVALDLINLALELKKDAKFYHLKGKILFSQRDIKNAKKMFDKAIKSYNKKKDKDKSIIANMYRNYAKSNIMLGGKHIETALQNFEKAIKQDKNNVHSYIEYSSALNKNNEPNKAIKILKKAEKIEPSNHYIYARYGDSYAKKMNFKKALEYYDKSIKMNPTDTKTYEKKENLLLAQRYNATNEHKNENYIYG